MGRWYTSYHHLGHENIIRYCGRPFPDADTMDKEMVARWNDLVADGDEAWILGDLVMGGKTQGLASWVARHKGRKILVPGNHDLATTFTELLSLVCLVVNTRTTRRGPSPHI